MKGILPLIDIRSLDSDKEDLDITKKIYERLTLNLKSELKIFETINRPMEEIANEISNI